MGFFQGTQTRVQNSHGKRAICVRATEVLLYNDISLQVLHYIGQKTGHYSSLVYPITL